MYRIAVIGAGQLGSRHLQGLAKIALPVSLTVVDRVPASLGLAKERFRQVPESNRIAEIRYLSSCSDLPRELDLAIVATTADVRAAATREMLRTTNIRNILFEKVVFQTEEDFAAISRDLADRNIKAWVNCPRRVYPFYRMVKGLLENGDRITISLQGGEWGLACNAIHFLDLIAFLAGTDKISVDIDWLDQEIIDSPRKGFIELTGSLRGRLSNGGEFTLHARKGSTAPHMISLLGSAIELIIDEGRGAAYLAKKGEAWKWEETQFRVPYQSELTGGIAADILQTGTCGLPTLEESAALHKPFLRAVLQHIKNTTGKSLTACPIT